MTTGNSTPGWRLNSLSRGFLRAVFLLALHSPAPSVLAALVLSTDADPNPLIIKAGDVGAFTVNVASAGMATHVLSGWQFNLALAPLAGDAVVEFAIPSALAEPTNYVFPDFSAFTSTETAAQVIILDALDDVADAVEIPSGDGSNLAEVWVQAQPGTSGAYGIFAVPGQFSTVWIDGTAPVPNQLAFENVPFSAPGQVKIGEIYVIETVVGDYNNDGAVNAGDYVQWRNNVGAPAGTLPNDTDGGIIGPAQYNTWKANFGMVAALGTSSASAVPEPCAWSLVLPALVTGMAAARRSHRLHRRE